MLMGQTCVRVYQHLWYNSIIANTILYITLTIIITLNSNTKCMIRADSQCIRYTVVVIIVIIVITIIVIITNGSWTRPNCGWCLSLKSSSCFDITGTLLYNKNC